MRVLVTHERFAPDFAGGGEYVVLEMVRHLIRAGIDVRVVTAGDPTQDRYDGIAVTRLPVSRYALNLQSRRIAEYARDVDVILTSNYHACWASWHAARRVNRPIVCSFFALFGDAWLSMKGPIAGRLFRAWERRLVQIPFDRTLFMSEYSLQMGLEMGAPPKTSEAWSPGVDVELYGPAGRKDYVLFVGKFDVRKGIGDIIEVAKRLPDVPFVLYGWGSGESALLSGAPANVRIESFERGEPLRAKFASARIFLFPSRAETFGVAVIEAMASGCAIVSSVPLDFEGIQVAPGDIDAMTSAVRTIWNDEKEAARMGRVNIERSAAYSWGRCLDRLVTILEETARRA